MDLKPMLEVSSDLQHIRLPNNSYSISGLLNTPSQNGDPLLSGFTVPMSQMPPVVVTNFQPGPKYCEYYIQRNYFGRKPTK